MVTAPRSCASSAAACAATTGTAPPARRGEGRPRRLRLRQHRHARRARRLGRGRDGGATGGVTGRRPARSSRRRWPPSRCTSSRRAVAGTSARAIRCATRRSCAATRRTTGSTRRSSPPSSTRSAVRRGRPLELGRGRAHAAPAGDGAGDRRPHGRPAFASTTSRPGAQRPLRLLVPPAPVRQVRRRGARARRLQRGAGQRRPLARARGGIEFAETRHYVERVQSSSGSTPAPTPTSSVSPRGSSGARCRSRSASSGRRGPASGRP